MKKSKKEKEIFHSLLEFEREYFPMALEKRVSEMPTDAHALGVRLAKESLHKIRTQLLK